MLWSRKRVKSIRDVAEMQLCTGCGVCASMQPSDIRMVDDPDAGRRPIVRQVDGRDVPTDQALEVCPGRSLAHGAPPDGRISELAREWGPVLEVWEGHASDTELRFGASSGGAATAIAEAGLAMDRWEGVLHIRARPDLPLLNETVRSTTPAELRAATGSRYAPASPGDRLDLIRDSAGGTLFIGKPCDVAGVRLAAESDAVLGQKLAGTIALFCAGTPSMRGTLEMLDRMGISDVSTVESVRYRGNGWPGDATAVVSDDGDEREVRLTYDQSWGDILQRHRQWRCYVCADHTGEFADIAVGDPWYREVAPDEPGRSLVLVRTERGRELLATALASGQFVAQPVPWRRVPESQPGLRKVRGAVWGRLMMSRLAGVPAPEYSGLPMLRAWRRELSLREKMGSTFGLLRRIRVRGLWKRHPVVELETEPTKDL